MAQQGRGDAGGRAGEGGGGLDRCERLSLSLSLSLSGPSMYEFDAEDEAFECGAEKIGGRGVQTRGATRSRVEREVCVGGHAVDECWTVRE